MSEWMIFVAIIFGMILAFVLIEKWIEATVKIKQILSEELKSNGDQDNSESD